MLLSILSGLRVVIAAVVPAAGDEDQPRMEALLQSVQAAGGIVTATLIQRRGVSRSRNRGGARSMRGRAPLYNPTFLGKGKTQELVRAVIETNAEMVVFPNQLTDTQITNLEKRTGVTVISVTMEGI